MAYYCATLECAEHALPDKLQCAQCLWGKFKVVLDLDKTLIFTNLDTSRKFNITHDFEVDGLLCYKRPNLYLFLAHVFANFEVCIWTAGSREYADYILKEILHPNQKPLQILTGNDTGRKFAGYYNDLAQTKPLWKIRADLSRIVIVDDKTSSFACNMSNGIHISAFQHPDIQHDDKALLDVLDLLKVLAHEKDVRPLARPHFDCTSGPFRDSLFQIAAMPFFTQFLFSNS